MQLVKGTSRQRRRFLDLLLTQTQRLYLPLLQRYAAALRARNALLKQRSPDESALDSFTQQLVEAGEKLMQYRRELIPQIAPLASAAYGRVSRNLETLELEYQPSVKQDFLVELARNRSREAVFRSTIIGPHRDEIGLKLDGKSAAKFASEGQKRSITIALKMTQAEFLANSHGSPPILLIDDIMGELDAKRRSAFLPLLSQAQAGRSQVFMTCTEENWPQELGRDLHRWNVRAGAIKRA